MTTAIDTPAVAETPVKRRPGRPRKDPNAIPKPRNRNAARPPAATAQDASDWNPQWEEFGGDLDALASIPKGSRVQLSSKDDFESGLPSLQRRGLLICRADPTRRFNWAWLEEDTKSQHTIRAGRGARVKGYRIATSDEFALNPAYRDTIVADSANRYVVPDLSGKSTAVVLVRDEAAWAAARREQLRFSDEIQVSAKERSEKLQETLREGGINATTDFTVEATEKF